MNFHNGEIIINKEKFFKGYTFEMFKIPLFLMAKMNQRLYI